MTDDEADFAMLWRAGVPEAQIAEVVGILASEAVVWRRRLALPARRKGGVRVVTPAASAAVAQVSEARARRSERRLEDVDRGASPDWTEAQDSRLREARRYAERAVLAAEWGKSLGAVEARFQRVRP